MKCSSCGYDNTDDAVNCVKCNDLLSVASEEADSDSPPAPTTPSAPSIQSASIPSVVQPRQPAAPVQPTSYTPPPYPSAPPRTTPPYPYPQPPYVYPPFVPKANQPFTITDAYIVIGFVLAIVGIFAYAFLLLPISIGFSVVGFVKRTNTRTHGLSLAGIVVGVVACLIKVGLVLNELGLIPDWLSAGIF